MEVVEVNGNAIGELSKLVKKIGDNQRELVLELSKDLGKQNKMIERAVNKSERLILKIDRIESKMMEKEIYNYSNITSRINRQKELAREQAHTNADQGKFIDSSSC